TLKPFNSSSSIKVCGNPSGTAPTLITLLSDELLVSSLLASSPHPAKKNRNKTLINSVNFFIYYFPSHFCKTEVTLDKLYQFDFHTILVIRYTNRSVPNKLIPPLNRLQKTSSLRMQVIFLELIIPSPQS